MSDFTTSIPLDDFMQSPTQAAMRAAMGVNNVNNLPVFIGQNCILVQVANTGTSADPITNGAALLAAYAVAKARTTPNGSAQAYTNAICILCPQAVYDLNGGTLNMDTDFIHLKALSDRRISNSQHATIRSSVSAAGGCVINVTAQHGADIEGFDLQNTAAVSENVAFNSNFAAAVKMDPNANTLFTDCEFLGINAFVAATADALPVSFLRCIGTIGFKGFSGSVEGCFFNIIGDGTSSTAYFANSRNYNRLSFTDVLIGSSIVDSDVFLLSTSSDGSCTVNLGSASQFRNCLISCDDGGFAVKLVGKFLSCRFNFDNVLLGTILAQDCYIVPGIQNVAASSFPKFHGCDFRAKLDLDSSGTVDIVHCRTNSTWTSGSAPANLSYALGSFAAGFNVAAVSTSWNP